MEREEKNVSVDIPPNPPAFCSPFDGHFNPHPSDSMPPRKPDAPRVYVPGHGLCDPELAKLLTPYPEYDEPENDHKNE
jgi:hypothetical protein